MASNTENPKSTMTVASNAPINVTISQALITNLSSTIVTLANDYAGATSKSVLSSSASNYFPVWVLNNTGAPISFAIHGIPENFPVKANSRLPFSFPKETTEVPNT